MGIDIDIIKGPSIMLRIAISVRLKITAWYSGEFDCHHPDSDEGPSSSVDETSLKRTIPKYQHLRSLSYNTVIAAKDLKFVDEDRSREQCQ